MCSICGLYNTNGDAADGGAVLAMSRTMRHRGPDADGFFEFENVCFAHNRLAVIDIENGKQPMSAVFEGREYTIVYNGEIYNAPELRRALSALGAHFNTDCDTEVVLWSYIMYKEHCSKLLNGIFAFAVFDKAKNRVYLSRDRLGVKPLYYVQKGESLYFASETKAFIKGNIVAPKVDKRGIWQLLFLSPSTIPSSDVFRDICEIQPGENAIIDRNGMRKWRYWELEAKEFKGSGEEAAETVIDLLWDAVRRQLVSDVPLCTFLSGGLDSSVITAIGARILAERGESLSSYSFEYENNRQNFKNTLFQPASDDEYAKELAKELGTDHTVLVAPNRTVADCLYGAVEARDYPGQADIDSSLLYFCSLVRKNHTVALSGECSDEIFGGYPWFYRSEMLERDFFPWVHDPFARTRLFKEDAVNSKEGYEYMSKVYKKTVESAPCLEEDESEMIVARRATVLSTAFFMQHLLCRKDRMSMACSLEVRVPFADHRIIEYVYNVPWTIKFENGVEKALLRKGAAKRNLLPDKVLYRKKSPYPKTHSPEYEKAVKALLSSCLKKDNLFTSIIDKKQVSALIDDSSQSATWFGQLMSRPQLIAWLYQFSCWCDIYNVELV